MTEQKPGITTQVKMREIHEINSVPSFAVDKFFSSFKGHSVRLSFCEEAVGTEGEIRARCAVTMPPAVFRNMVDVLNQQVEMLDKMQAEILKAQKEAEEQK